MKTCTVALIALLSFLMTGVHAKIQTGPRETSCIKGGHKHDEDDQDDEAYWRVARFSAKADDDDYNTRVHIHSGKQQQKRHSSLRQVVAKPDDDEETSNRNKIHVATIFHWKTLAAGVPDSSRIVASPFQTKNDSNHHNDYDIEDSKLEEVNETCSFSPATGERMHVSRQDVFSDYITA